MSGRPSRRAMPTTWTAGVGDGDEKVVRKVHMNWGLLYSANEEEGKKYYTTTQKIHDLHSRSMCRIV